MTGYTVHTGSTDKFTKGWDQIFKKDGATAAADDEKSATAAKSEKKVAGKSGSVKKAAKKRK